MARQDNKWAAANGALRLIAKAAGLLDGKSQAPVQVAMVTVVLASREEEPEALEASYRVLPDRDTG